MKQRNKPERLKQGTGTPSAFLWGLAACVCLGILVNSAFAFLRYEEFANYDSSPELVLAKILSGENALLTRSWFYSTEIRVLNTQIVNMLLMKLFSSWRAIKTLSVFLHLLLLEAAYLFFARRFEEHRKTVLLGAVLLLLPRNWDYVLYTLAGEYYIPHLFILFLALGLFHKVREAGTKAAAAAWLLPELLLAVLAGMGGPRQLEMTYLPLAASALFCLDLSEGKGRKAAGDAAHVLLVLAAAAAGYLINGKLLSARYFFEDYGGTSLQYIGFGRLEEVLKELLVSWGYDGTAELFSVRGIAGLGAVAAVGGAVLLALHVLFHSVGKKLNMPYAEKQVLLFTLFSWLLRMAVNLFVGVGYDARYYIPQNTMLIVAVLLLLPYCKREYRLTAAVFFCAVLVLGSAVGAKIWLTEERSSSPSFRQAVAYIQEREYTRGYVLQYRNFVPELTNGQVDVCCLERFEDMSIDRWLIKTEMAEMPSYTGRVFMLMNKAEYEEVKDLPHIRLGETGYDDGETVVLEFEDNAGIWALLPEAEG